MAANEVQRTIEVERLINLVQGFGWTKIKEELEGKKVRITVEKELLTAAEVVGGAGPQ